jgi:hypothetical protein
MIYWLKKTKCTDCLGMREEVNRFDRKASDIDIENIRLYKQVKDLKEQIRILEKKCEVKTFRILFE